MSTANSKKCPNCGAIREANARFCGICGMHFSSSSENDTSRLFAGSTQYPIPPTEPALPPLRPKSQRKNLIIIVSVVVGVVVLIGILFLGIQLGKGGTTVTISATQPWQDTGVVVKVGDDVTIRYISGLWTTQAGVIAPFNGAGRTDGYTCASYLPASQCKEPVPNAPQGALVGMIATQLFKVGNYVNFPAKQGGSLFLRINDGDNALYDNQGSITVQIAVS